MEQFLKIFGEVTISDILIFALAVAFLWDNIKKAMEYIFGCYEREVEDKELKARMNDVAVKLDGMIDMTIALTKMTIKSECENYLSRGYITAQELEDLHELFDPYKFIGGNGTAAKLMAEVEKLPIK